MTKNTTPKRDRGPIASKEKPVLHIKLENELYDDIKKMSIVQDIPMSSIARRAIRVGMQSLNSRKAEAADRRARA